MQEEMNGFMSEMHGMIRALDPTEQPAVASLMEGISTTTQGAESQQNEETPVDILWE